MARENWAAITFDDARWMVSNQSLRQKTSIPSSSEAMIRTAVENYLQVDTDYFNDHSSTQAVTWNRIKWLYWVKNTFNVGAAGGIFYLRIETNLDWSVDKSTVPSWISIDQLDTYGTGDKDIPFEATQNPSSTTSRTANIRVQVGAKTYVHELIQPKRTVQTTVHYFDIEAFSIEQTRIGLRASDLSLMSGPMTIAYRKVGGENIWEEIHTTIPGVLPQEWYVSQLDAGTEYEFQLSTSRGQGTPYVNNYVSNVLTVNTVALPSLTLNMSSKTVDAEATSFNFDVNSNIKWAISDNRNWIGITMPYRNLLRDSDKTVSSGAYQIASYTLGKQIPDGAQVTMQIKGQLGSNNTYFGIYNSGGTVSINSLWPANQDSDGVYRKTFNWKVGGASNTNVRVYQMPSGAAHGSTIDWIMLTEDNIVTNGEVTVGPTGNQSMRVYTLGKSIPNGTQVTVQMKATLGKDYFGLYTNNGNTYVNEFWPANSSNGVFTKTFTWNGGSSKNLTVYQYGGGGTSTIEYIRVNVNDDKTWVTAPEDTQQAGFGTVENIVANVGMNSGSQRTGTITASGTGVPNRTIAVTQRAIQLYAIQLRARTSGIFPYEGADNPDAAMNNMYLHNVYSTTNGYLNFGPGTRFFADSNANQVFSGLGWFRIGSTPMAVMIDATGNFVQSADTSQFITLSSVSQFTSSGGSRTVSVTSNTGWTVSNSPSWITIGSGSGSGNGSFTATASSNTGSSRNGTITVRSLDSMRTATVSVSQAAAAASAGVFPSMIQAPASGGNQYVEVRAPGQNWTVNIPFGAPFGFSVSPMSGTGTNMNVRLSIPSNPFNNTLLFTFEVTIGGTKYLVTVNQAGQPFGGLGGSQLNTPYAYQSPEEIGELNIVQIKHSYKL